MAHQLVILSGPPNAGKSATAEALCQRYDRMLHIDVAVLRDFLRMGRLRPWDASPEGRRQRLLLIESALDMARRFLVAGYGVIIDDVVGPDDLPAYRDGLSEWESTAHFIVLLPRLALILEREQVRASEWQRAGRLEALYQRFVEFDDAAIIDPETLAPELVADRVMALAANGTALILPLSLS